MGPSHGKKSSNYDQVRRTILVFLNLQRTRIGLTVDEIALIAGVSRRTAYRIVKILEDVGIKVERIVADKASGKWRFRIDPNVVAGMRIPRPL